MQALIELKDVQAQVGNLAIQLAKHVDATVATTTNSKNAGLIRKQLRLASRWHVARTPIAGTLLFCLLLDSDDYDHHL
jgi:hypothetical protein